MASYSDVFVCMKKEDYEILKKEICTQDKFDKDILLGILNNEGDIYDPYYNSTELKNKYIAIQWNLIKWYYHNNSCPESFIHNYLRSLDEVQYIILDEYLYMPEDFSVYPDDGDEDRWMPNVNIKYLHRTFKTSSDVDFENKETNSQFLCCMDEDELVDLIRAYDLYIQTNANENEEFGKSWFPVCIAEFYNNDWKLWSKKKKSVSSHVCY